MQTEQVKVRFTYEDHLLAPDDGMRREIIDGEEHVAAAPTTRHQRIVFRLSGILYDHLSRTGQGEAFAAPTDVVLSETDVPQPDLLFISDGRLSIVEKRGVFGAPDLVVEVLSEGNRRHDEVRKRKLYERYGVREYWIVDPELDAVKVYRMTASGYRRTSEASAEAGDTLTTPLLPGLEIPLAPLFA